MNIEALDWDKMDGLIPAIIQDNDTRQVLMLGYVNRESLQITLNSQTVTFYSRSKKRLWQKGEVSGNTLQVVDIYSDCDNDSCLILVKAGGPCCHQGSTTCFLQEERGLSFIASLEKTIAHRKSVLPDDSYCTELFNAGTVRIAQKVGEEAVETALAAATGDQAALKSEAADLLFHLLVLLQAQNLSLNELAQVLQTRRNPAN